MSELLHTIIVVLAVIVAAVSFVGAAFFFGLFVYFYRWRESLKEPGEQA